MQQIARRLQAGELRAVSASAFIDEKPGSTPFAKISATLWRKHFDDFHDTPMWRTGDLDMEIEYESLRRRVTNHFLDVRLHPDDFAKIPGVTPTAPAPSLSANTPPHKRTGGKTITEGMLAKFVALHVEAFPNDNAEEPLWEAAKAYFHDRDVPRSRMRPAIEVALGPRQRGRRASTKVDPAN